MTVGKPAHCEAKKESKISHQLVLLYSTQYCRVPTNASLIQIQEKEAQDKYRYCSSNTVCKAKQYQYYLLSATMEALQSVWVPAIQSRFVP